MLPQHRLIALYLLRRRRKRVGRQKPRKFWVQPAFLKRNSDGEYNRIFLPMKNMAAQGDLLSLQRFYQYTRLELAAFETLLNLLRTKLVIWLFLLNNFIIAGLPKSRSANQSVPKKGLS
jgi:hypothetical protein